MKRFILGTALVAGAVTATAASAHDFFLLPTQFTTAGTGNVHIQATVGSSFPKPEAAVPADRAERVTAYGAGNPRVSVGAATKEALGLDVSGARPGLLAVGVTSKARDVDYAEDRIPLILGEYRVLPRAAAAVEALPRPRTWQVVSRRFAKTFVCVRTCSNRAAAAQSFGAPLEFVGTRGSANHYLLLGNGKPLTNYPVDLVGTDGKRAHLSTNARGEIHLPANARGTMMLFAAMLEPPVGSGRFTLDLTSLTFNRN
jgi:hypothetical protein